HSTAIPRQARANDFTSMSSSDVFLSLWPDAARRGLGPPHEPPGGHVPAKQYRNALATGKRDLVKGGWRNSKGRQGGRMPRAANGAARAVQVSCARLPSTCSTLRAHASSAGSSLRKPTSWMAIGRPWSPRATGSEIDGLCSSDHARMNTELPVLEISVASPSVAG